jgi:hypothetical protein
VNCLGLPTQPRSPFRLSFRQRNRVCAVMVRSMCRGLSHALAAFVA